MAKWFGWILVVVSMIFITVMALNRLADTQSSVNRSMADLERARGDSRATVIEAQSQARLDSAHAQAQLLAAQGQAQLMAAQAETQRLAAQTQAETQLMAARTQAGTTVIGVIATAALPWLAVFALFGLSLTGLAIVIVLRLPRRTVVIERIESPRDPILVYPARPQALQKQPAGLLIDNSIFNEEQK